MLVLDAKSNGIVDIPLGVCFLSSNLDVLIFSSSHHSVSSTLYPIIIFN